jgi:hypothetical protein
MIEGLSILLFHLWLKNANIQPESITSTINKKTSIEFARFFYFMAPKVESFVSLGEIDEGELDLF